MVNTPIPHSLKSEAKKAAKILREFTIPTAKAGPDKLIPAGIFAKARGLAIITVFKAGFLVSARGGSGIVIAKVNDSFDFASGWSAPSAIGMAGLGGGFEIGAEVTDFVIILNSKSAVEAFSKGGNLTLGGNFTIAAGPLGRNVEGDIAVRSPAAIYTYSKTKGIFAGISVEGSALIERKDANRKFYGKSIRAHQILQGEVEIPEECEALYLVMREHQEMAARAALKMAKNKMKEGIAKNQSEWNLSSRIPFSSSSSASSSKSSSHHHSQSSAKSSSTKSPTKSSTSTKRGSFSSLSSFTRQRRDSDSSSRQRRDSDSPSRSSNYSMPKPSISHPTRQRRSSDGISAKPKNYESRKISGSSSAMHDPWADIDKGKDLDTDGLWVVADFPYQAQLSCDLSFQAGVKLLVTWNSNSQEDWWEGITRDGRQGIFPANYCHVMNS